jgi:hypothetical protein
MKKTFITSLITATLFLLCHTVLAQTHTYQSTHPIRFLAGGVGLPGGASPGYVKEECYVSFYNWPDTPIDFSEVSAWYFDENGEMVDLGYSTSVMENYPWPSIVYEYPSGITNLHYYWSVFYTDGTYEIQQIDYDWN